MSTETTANPLVALQRLGQSPWHDNIHRGLLRTRKLARMVADGDITGLTSNPTIFEQAIGGSTDYDDALAELARKGKSAEQIFDALAIQDIRDAADVFAPVFKRTAGRDGFVSIEVAPKYANDTDATIREARRLWKAVNRPNLMVKIPATKAGLPAIAQCIADGININITLIFALARYDEVMDAYLTGLDRRVTAGKRVDRIASVASFFVSRVDTAVDERLGPEHEALHGKAAIANAKLAYAAFREKFGGTRFAALARSGARVQRPLWASTSTKNPAYPDVYYVEALIGPDTVDTMPPATLVAYKDHGKPEVCLDKGLDEARGVMAELAAAGIDMDAVTLQLELDGVASFAKSFDSLIATVGARREAVLVADRTRTALGPATRRVETTCAALDHERFGARLWQKDPTLWKPDDPAHQAEIAKRLGWLDVVDTMQGKVGELHAFADEVRRAGLKRVVLCGMGGSSLAPEVLRATFGVARGFLDVAVLDSTDPAAVLAAARRSAPAETLYLIASKSGSTTEPNAFFEFFWDRVRAERGERAGEHFIAITDPGTEMAARARSHDFRHVFLNPPDIGGRYAALSYFGLVPAALLGIDVAKLLARAKRMMLACAAVVPAGHNPGLRLGAALAVAGRDKVTFLASDRVASFGAWAEQLLAESTGKEGKGLVPVEGEPPGKPAVYGKDRLFVYLRLGPRYDRVAAALARAGHPLVELHLTDAYDLGGEFLRWEVATAAAGRVLGIDPFDQPNVQESKDNTVRLLAEYAATGRLPDRDGAIPVDAPDLPARLKGLLGKSRNGDYVAITAYVERTPRRELLLRELRAAVRGATRRATTVGYGPRFLHSTGQLHKGGPASGIFLQLTCEDPVDVPVPGEKYSFGILKTAQALGDYQSLAARNRRALRLTLGRDVEAGLRTLLAAIAGKKAGRRPRTPRLRAVALRKAM